MFDVWHLTAIVIVFALGFFFGRLSMRAKYEAKVEELENKKPSTRIIVKEVKVDKKGRKL